MVDTEEDHADPEPNHANQEVDLARKEGQVAEEGDNKKEGDAKPSTVTPAVKEPPRTFVPKAPKLILP